MTGKDIVKNIIEYLQQKKFKYLYFLHAAHFGYVIAMLDPDGRQVSVKIVKIEDICPVEDRYWKAFKHPHLIEVYQVLTIQDLGVRIYITPLLTKKLYDILHDDNFRKDENSFRRIKKWLFQALCAMEHLHSQGFCHLNMRVENIFIDDEDNAVLTDFSSLNFTKSRIDR